MAQRPQNLRLLVFLGLMLIASACSPGLSGGPATTQADDHTLTLTTPDEPGLPLTIHGLVLDAATQQPIPEAHLKIYHADANGEYQPAVPEDESTARLSGEVRSGPDGRFTLHTIVPREYDVPGNRHIHLHSVQASGYQDFGGVVLFEADVNDEIRQWALDTGFGTIIELQEQQGVMVGELTILLESN
jgi:protocatechuate 3,4-dioxygenase beta subunit